MRKWFTCGFLVLALSLVMCTTAFAQTEGITPGTMVDGIKATTVSGNPDQLSVTYSTAAANSEYVIFATSGTAAPTESNLVYIDQKTAGTGGVSFNVYPKALTNGTYQVWMSSNASGGIGAGEVQKIGNFTYYTEKPAVTLGDVNMDTEVDSGDAILILKYAVGNAQLSAEQMIAAEVDGYSEIDSGDAICILKFAVGNISKFPVEGN